MDIIGVNFKLFAQFFDNLIFFFGIIFYEFLQFFILRSGRKPDITINVFD